MRKRELMNEIRALRASRAELARELTIIAYWPPPGIEDASSNAASALARSKQSYEAVVLECSPGRR